MISKLLRFCLLVLAVTLSFSGPCQSYEVSNRTALIVGVSVYDRPEITELKGVLEDIKSAIVIAKAMGIPEKNIRILRNEQATKDAVLQALRELGERTTDGARTFFYYSGHGTRWTDPQAGGCVEALLTYDYKVLTNSDIAASTKGLSEKADKFVTMYDTCHSGGVASKLATSRSISNTKLTPKFYAKVETAADACSLPTNFRTRSLLGEATRLGTLAENFVQITSALPNEVSFDDPEKGGLATQGIRDCLLGKATDLDSSGAVSMAEIQQCAQAIVNEKLRNVAMATPNHVTVSGNRNLIPVQRPKPPQANPAPEVLAVAPAVPNPATPPAPVAQVPPASPQPVIAPVDQVESQKPLAALPPVTPPKPPKPEPVLASLATLKDIEQQRNPKRVLNVTMSKAALKIGKDELDFKVTSNHDGYVYLVMLGSDAQSFYVLFPNGLDGNNRISAGKPLRLPKPDWAVKAAGPAGTNQLLVMVSDSPRKLDSLTMAEPTAAVPFTYALNTLGGRTALIDFLTGSGLDGKSESFGAKLVSVKEVP